jgi:hypothetical protein
MHILLLVAHGSRREESNIEIKSLSEKISKFESKEFDKVMSAFLELASPSIPDCLIFYLLAFTSQGIYPMKLLKLLKEVQV